MRGGFAGRRVRRGAVGPTQGTTRWQSTLRGQLSRLRSQLHPHVRRAAVVRHVIPERPRATVAIAAAASKPQAAARSAQPLVPALSTPRAGAWRGRKAHSAHARQPAAAGRASSAATQRRPLPAAPLTRGSMIVGRGRGLGASVYNRVSTARHGVSARRAERAAAGVCAVYRVPVEIGCAPHRLAGTVFRHPFDPRTVCSVTAATVSVRLRVPDPSQPPDSRVRALAPQPPPKPKCRRPPRWSRSPPSRRRTARRG